MRINHVFMGCAASFGYELAAGAWAQRAAAPNNKAAKTIKTGFFMPGSIHRPALPGNPHQSTH
jgi:hypothetical protein